jgi:bifunctional DNase/RNase
MSDDQLVLIDSRPSDAIALALRVDCPIFIREEVLEASKRSDGAGIQDDEEEEVEWPEEIDDINDYKM